MYVGNEEKNLYGLNYFQKTFCPFDLFSHPDKMLSNNVFRKINPKIFLNLTEMDPK